MLQHLKQVLTPAEVRFAQDMLVDAPWSDGRASAGTQAALVKNNAQLPHDCDAAKALRAMVLKALDSHPLFFAATLPKKLFTPRFNRYGQSANADPMFYGAHIDNAIRFAPDTGQRVRTDISGTLFLTDPDSYEGGELVVQDTYGEQRVKLPAGDLVLYPGTSIHQVTPVTKGVRLACFFWIESMVRSDEQRRILVDLDHNIQSLRSQHGETAEAVALTGTYHNLLRMWADT
jgi:PKHD-type hydroxylase